MLTRALSGAHTCGIGATRSPHTVKVAGFAVSSPGTLLAARGRVNPTILAGKACLVLEEPTTSLQTGALEQAGMHAARTSTAEAALRELSSASWDALVVDLDVPGAIAFISSALSSPAKDAAILTTSLRGRRDAVIEAYGLGLPFVPRTLLTRAMYAWMVAAVSSRQASEYLATLEISPSRRGPELSPREAAVFSLLTRGRAPKEIAHALGITHETVRTHARKAYRKMGVSNLREAMAALLDA